MSGRLRTASDLEELGYIDKNQKGVIKDLIISGNADVQKALDKYRTGDQKELEDMIREGHFSARRHSIDLLEGLDLEYLQVQIGKDSRSGSMISMMDDDCVDVEYDIDNYNLYGGTMGIGFAEVSDDRRNRTGSIILSSNLPFVEGNLELDGAWAIQPFSNMGIGFDNDVDMNAYQAVALSLEAAKGSSSSSSKGKGKDNKKTTRITRTPQDSQRASPHTVNSTNTTTTATASIPKPVKKEYAHVPSTTPAQSSAALPSVQQQDLSLYKYTTADNTSSLSSSSLLEAPSSSLIYGLPKHAIYIDDTSSALEGYMRPPPPGHEYHHYDGRIDISSLSAGLSSNGKQSGYIGAYSPEARKLRIQRFNEKRHRRVWTKKVKYDVRKNFADSRLRVKGRFVKKEDEELMRELKDLSGEDDLLEMSDANDGAVVVDANSSASDYGTYY